MAQIASLALAYPDSPTGTAVTSIFDKGGYVWVPDGIAYGALMWHDDSTPIDTEAHINV